MLIDTDLLSQLSETAKCSPRLRINYDLRNSENDLSQRMLNAVEPGTVMPIHWHPTTSTTVIILRGAIRLFYDDNGAVTESVILDADGKNRAVQIEKGRWHNLENLQSGTVLFEAKDGAWQMYELMKY